MLTDSSDIQVFRGPATGAAHMIIHNIFLVLHQAFHPVWWQDCPVLPPDSYHRGSPASKTIISGSDAAGQSCHRDGYAMRSKCPCLQDPPPTPCTLQLQYTAVMLPNRTVWLSRTLG